MCKSAKRFCSYCLRERSVKLFTKDPTGEICDSCFYFDKSARITSSQVPQEMS